MAFKWKDQQKKYHKEYHAKWYQKNKDKVKIAAQAAKKRKSKWFRELKSKYSCSRCGLNHPAIIDFHHVDPTQKDFMIARFDSKSKAKILAEIKKCIPLCRNCHAIVHWEMRENA